MASGIGDTLRMVARTRGDEAPRPLFRAQVRDAVVGPANLVGEDRLQILALQQYVVAGPLRKQPRRFERRLAGDVVDAAVENEAQ